MLEPPVAFKWMAEYCDSISMRLIIMKMHIQVVSVNRMTFIRVHWLLIIV